MSCCITERPGFSGFAWADFCFGTTTFGRATRHVYRRKGRPSFLKKRSKRLLFLALRQLSGHGLDLGSGGGIKVFWFFSSEKNVFLHLLPDQPPFCRMFNGRPA
jgi:hypothetical protein